MKCYFFKETAGSCLKCLELRKKRGKQREIGDNGHRQKGPLGVKNTRRLEKATPWTESALNFGPFHD